MGSESAHSQGGTRPKRNPNIAACAIVAFFVLILLPAGGFGAMKLFKNLVFADFKPRAFTLSWDSHNCVNQWGWETVNQNPLSIVVQSKPRGQSLIDGLRGIAMEYLTRDLIELQGNYSYLALSLSTYFMPGYLNTTYVGGINNDSLLFSVFWDTMQAKPYVEDIQDHLDNSWIAKTGDFSLTVTGIPPLESAMKHTVLSNMGMIDAVCIPLGLIIFAIAVRTSPFTMLVPLFTLIISLVGGLGLSAPLHPTLIITAFAPEMMMSVVIALSMDFSMFLLSRIREQREIDAKAGYSRPKGEMVWLCLKRVSHNIVISGFAVTLAFGGLLFIDDDFVRGCAAVSAIGALFTTITSVTFMPSVVVLMYSILFDWTAPCTFPTFLRRKEKEVPLIDQDDEDTRHDNAGRWFRIVRFATRRPIAILTPVLLVVATFLYVLIDGFDYDDSTLSIVPYNINYFPLFTDVEDLFGTAGMAPYYIIVSSLCSANGDGQSMLSAEHFPVYDLIVDKLLASPAYFGVTEKDIIAPNLFNGDRVSYNESTYLVANDTVYLSMLSMCIGSDYISPGNTPYFTAISLLPPKAKDSYGPPQKAYLKNLENLVKEIVADSSLANITKGLFLGFYGPQVGLWATMGDVMQQFKVQVIITLAVLTLVICVLFRSVIMALRMIVTMFMTLCFSFGMVTCIVHYHWFDNVWAPMKHVDAYFWVIPILSFSIVCVISLDYDVFLMTRVLELRKHVGQNDPDAHPDAKKCKCEADCMIYAVGRTGEVISWAATIMFVAFGALGFANTVMMSTYGMTIAFAVVFDAFIVRPMVVPALVSLLSSLGLAKVLWWPRSLPAFPIADEEERFV